MTMDYKRYPPDWAEISQRIRFERAQGKCEQCGLPHGAIIMRSTVDAARYLILNSEGVWETPDGDWVRLSELPREFDESDVSKVVLTTHHVGAPKPDGTPGDRHDKLDCRDENLMALCQRCHFIADLDIHIEKARKARLANKRKRVLATGQLELGI